MNKKYVIVLIVLSLFFFNFAFYYLFSMDLKGVLISLLYFVFSILLPGFLMSAYFFSLFRKNTDDLPSGNILLPMTVILGTANILISYFSYQLSGQITAIYVFVWAYLLIFLKPVRTIFVNSIRTILKNGFFSNRKLAIALFFILLLNLFFFQMRPTPGLLPLEILQDKLWNSENTVSLMRHFPLQSMNIETKPFIAYHILLHLVGAHMALVTGLIPHMVGLQYIFVPLVPILVFSILMFLYQFFSSENKYYFYGLAVILFGGGFHLVHEVKVQNINSSTNFIGLIFLFSGMILLLHLSRLNKSGRILLIFLTVFLATAAKGSIGLALFGGVMLWILVQIWKKVISFEDFPEAAGALVGFVSSYFLFFIYPELGQTFAQDFLEKGEFFLLPLTYVTKNFLGAPFVVLIYKYFPTPLSLVGHILFTLFFLPFYILLYFTYRLMVIYDFKINEVSEKQLKIFLVVIASLLAGYLLNAGTWQNHAYFLTAAMFLLDGLFIIYVQKEKLFARISSFYKERNIFASIGIIVVLIIPFITIPGWIRPEQTNNLLMYGKIGQVLDSRLQNTTYRQERQTITPSLYNALQYIRKNTRQDVVVVTPLLKVSDGRTLAFFTSTFSERTSFVEGFYQIEDIPKYVDSAELFERLEVRKEIYENFNIPLRLLSKEYIFLIKKADLEKFTLRYKFEILYQNSGWCVLLPV